MSNKNWTTADIPDLTGKVIIVTGGNSGLGYESVKAFAEKGAEVVLASRTVEKGESAKKEMSAVKDKIEVMQLDLQDFASIEKFALAFKKKYDRLDVLLNNAGVMTTPYFKTKDGLEGQMGTNHFGHFKLTGHLLDVMVITPNSRVVNVSSGAHKQGVMDFENLMFEKGGYSPLKAYGRSKLSNLLFTYELQRFFEVNKIGSIAVAAHPGVSRTNLDRYIKGKWWFKLLYPVFKSFTQDQAQGALPEIRAAVDPEVKGSEYYGPDGKREMKGFPVKVESNEASHKLEDAKKLWEMSEQITRVKYVI
jgi:NAD(P)-dependent dehydrogenase (short-subunit alcohol dehydrogenase family)